MIVNYIALDKPNIKPNICVCAVIFYAYHCIDLIYLQHGTAMLNSINQYFVMYVLEDALEGSCL